jgi:hypothetical protein
MKHKGENFTRKKETFRTKIIGLFISKYILLYSVSTCAAISVDKIRKNATFIKKVII